MEIPIKMDDLGVPLFLDTPIYDLFFSCDFPDVFWCEGSVELKEGAKEEAL